MQLELHQLDRRLECLRVRHPARQRRLIASLAECGQQTPIIVIESIEVAGRYLVIDGHKRIAALQQLGRDTVRAVVWEMSEADALLLDRTLRISEPDSALEQGWLLEEMESRLGCSIEELARRFDRSKTGWRAGWRWRILCPNRCSSWCAKARSPRLWPCVTWCPWRASAWSIAGAWLKRSPNKGGQRGKLVSLPSLASRQQHGARTPASAAEVIRQNAAATRHHRQATEPDPGDRATGAGASGIAEPHQRAAEDSTRNRVIDQTPPTNRGARDQPC